MHTRVALYTTNEGNDRDDILRRAQEEIGPRLLEMPGFVSYGVARDLNDVNGFVSISQWETEEAARQADNVVMDWVADNMAPQVTMISTCVAEFAFLEDPARAGIQPNT